MELAVNLVRVVNAILLSITVLASLGVMRFYYEVARKRDVQGERHLLPLHVWTISLSYILIGIAAVFFEMPLLLRQGITFVGLAIGTFALWVIFKGTYLRYHDR